MRKFYDALDDILDRPIAFNPSFKKITGSTNAALLLSQAFYWSKRTSNKDGWFYKTRSDWSEETGLGEDELDGARAKCRAAGVMEEKLQGVPATLHYRVNKKRVYELLGFQIPEMPESGVQEESKIPEKQESGNPADFNRNAEITTGITTVKKDDVKKISRLYESEIGALTPIVADSITDACNTYPSEWIEQAIKIAVERNARNWKYVLTVLTNAKQNKKSPILNQPAKFSKSVAPTRKNSTIAALESLK